MAWVKARDSERSTRVRVSCMGIGVCKRSMPGDEHVSERGYSELSVGM
jgi:hypothetical protein